MKWNVNITTANEVVIDTNRLIVGIPKYININTILRAHCTIQLNNHPHCHWFWTIVYNWQTVCSLSRLNIFKSICLLSIIHFSTFISDFPCFIDFSIVNTINGTSLCSIIFIAECNSFLIGSWKFIQITCVWVAFKSEHSIKVKVLLNWN